MPVLGFGTRQLTSGGECRDAVRVALRSGYRLIDTSPAYGNERDVGQGVGAAGLRREDVFIVSKLPDAHHGDLEDVQEALDASLRRLGASYVDLYLVGSPKGGSLLETWIAMLELRERGLIRAAGVANFGLHHLQGLAESGAELPEVNQVELHFAFQQRSLASYCAALGVVVMAASPLAGGRLFQAQTGLGALAAKRGRTEAELAVRWCLQRGYVPVPRSKDQRHIEADAAFGFSLASREMADIDALERRFVVNTTTKLMDLSWDDAVREWSEVSDDNTEGKGVGGKGQRPRRRRRRKDKGKGKGKTKGSAGPSPGGGGKGGGAAPGSGGKGGGSAASRWSDMLTGLR